MVFVVYALLILVMKTKNVFIQNQSGENLVIWHISSEALFIWSFFFKDVSKD